MKSRILSNTALSLTSAFALAVIPACKTKSPQQPPGFVIFLADDLGYGDLSCYGNLINFTPNLDLFASQGVRLTDCHSAGTVCSPSRAGILTGRNPYRSGFSYIAGGKIFLKNNEITIAELLKTKGYQTGFFGKWHLSSLEDSTKPDPGDQGFDYWLATSHNPFEGPQNPVHFIRNGKAAGKIEGWYCDIIVKESLEWLSRIDKKKPFLLVICTHEPHTPLAPPDSLSKPFLGQDLMPIIKTINYGGVDREQKYSQAAASKYYGTIKQLDNAFGVFMNKLDQSGFKDNTLVFFTSDNGPEHPVNLEESKGEWTDPIRDDCYGTPGVFKGMKRYPYEGGHRVPGIVRWPASIPANTISDQLFNGTDILPVFCKLAGVDIPAHLKIDGEPVFKALLNKPVERLNSPLWIFPAHEDSWFRMPHLAMRRNDYVILGWLPVKGDKEKIIDWVEQSAPVKFQLFDIKKDPGQLNDISSCNEQITNELSAEMVHLWLDIRQDYIDGSKRN